MRLFIACDLSPAQKHELEKVQHNLTSYLSGIRWVKPQGLHLTLSFLGDLNENLIGPIQKVLENVSATANPFFLKLGGCGVFPNISQARVLWVGVREGEEALQSIKKELDYGLEDLGYKIEKRQYKPHLTLGRMRYPVDVKLIRRFIEETENFTTTAVKVSTLILYESRLTAHGAFYDPQLEVDLKIQT